MTNADPIMRMQEVSRACQACKHASAKYLTSMQMPSINFAAWLIQQLALTVSTQLACQQVQPSIMHSAPGKD